MPELDPVETSGFLFAKLENVGTRSEGVQYFLQTLDPNRGFEEIRIFKKSQAWEPDNQLQKFLAKKVNVSGSLSVDSSGRIGIDYSEISQ